jgi:hypothetical protein
VARKGTRGNDAVGSRSIEIDEAGLRIAGRDIHRDGIRQRWRAQQVGKKPISSLENQLYEPHLDRDHEGENKMMTDARGKEYAQNTAEAGEEIKRTSTHPS